MARTYPVGWSCSLTVTRTAAGPTVRLLLRPEAYASAQVIEGLLSYEALGDVEALCFALLDEVTSDPREMDPF